MKTLISSVIWIISPLLLCSCMQSEQLKYALDFAGDNKKELQIVLEYYKNDDLKYKAACYLIENMPRYYCHQGNGLDSIKMWLATTDSFGVIEYNAYQKWKNFEPTMLPKLYDAQYITSDYLIKNIDLSFEVWNKRPWNHTLSFEDFCELVLPYRIDNEELDNWREEYLERYSFLLDEVYTGNDVIKAANIVCSYLQEESSFRFSWLLHHNHLNGEYLLHNRVGTCQDACDFVIYAMRALGIPVACDYYLFSPETRQGHIWNVVRDSNGVYIPFSFPDINITRKNKYTDDRLKGAIYRKYFGWQSNMENEILVDDNVPTIFKDGYSKNVSANYFVSSLDLSIDCSEKFAYLGVFSAKGWKAINIAKVKKGKVTFDNIEPNGIYILLSHQQGCFHPKGYPFYFDGNNVHWYLPDTIRCNSATLYRKYPLYQRMKTYMSHISGGCFEGSNDIEFHNTKILYTIEYIPTVNLNRIHLDNPVKCRYVRYLAPPHNCTEIAEMHFFEKGVESDIVNSWGDKPASIGSNYYQLYDNDPLTFFISKQVGGFVAFDLGKEMMIDSLTYMPRNDDNFITIGHEYELFYWKGLTGWQSLGKKIAIDTQLEYNNMPQGALFYLHDITKGEEELIFHMDEGQQKFIVGSRRLNSKPF